MGQHTPGPWIVGAGNETSPTVYPVCSGIPWIASCYSSKAHGRKMEGYFNARLIAAAPELLEACKAARDEWAMTGVKKNDPLLDQLNKAINKAIQYLTTELL